MINASRTLSSFDTSQMIVFSATMYIKSKLNKSYPHNKMTGRFQYQTVNILFAL